MTWGERVCVLGVAALLAAVIVYVEVAVAAPWLLHLIESVAK